MPIDTTHRRRQRSKDVHFGSITLGHRLHTFDMKTHDHQLHSRDHVSPRSVIRHDLYSMTPPKTRDSSPLRSLSQRINPTTTYSQEDLELRGHQDNKSKPSQPQKLIPFVSKLTLQQALPFIFSAFGDGANLYADVLGLEPSKREALSSARLRLAYFRKGREVLASPVEVDDEITTLTYQGISASSGLATSKAKVAIRSGVPISRKAKRRFQAICLAYEVLSDLQTRIEYDVFLKQQHPRRELSFAYQRHGRPSTKLDTIIERINSVPTSKASGKSQLSRKWAKEEASFYSYSDSRHSFSELDYSSDIVSPSDPDLSRSFSTTSSGLDSILRPTNASRLRKPVTPTRIRWNEQVEELVIMDYDAKNEHSIHPDDPAEKKLTQTMEKKSSKKKSSTRLRNDDDDDDVWSSSHPFFPEQDTDMPFDESGCYFPSRTTSRKSKDKKNMNRKNLGKDNRLQKDEWWEPENDDQDECSIEDESGYSTRSRRSGSERGEMYGDDFGGKDDDCGVPLAFDLAAGFQVALSKYLGNVLSEMKSGLSELGKTFSDIDVNQNQMPTQDKQCGGNEFFMDDYEVNALMSVLRSEMNQQPVYT